ncbi:MAG: hypothetical protein E6706_00085 [Anaerococcus hydrogenalis]|nr:hypothetical protein [Anaerococcus hydrogenalis]MDU3198780.1 hypothetical protein [Anaerococcus hydrogenalis]
MEDKFLLLKTSTGKEYKLKKISFFDKEKVLEKMYRIIEGNDKDDVIWLYVVDLYKEEKDKEYYYYKGTDTEKVEDKEYNKLKDLYIKKFGGWKKIDLENTEYNGKKWY